MGTSQSMEALKEESTSSENGKAKALLGDTQPRDAFITVIGASESAISTFMKTCSGKDAVGIGHGLMKVIFEYNGLKVHLINVPGFGDRRPSDTDPLVLIASYFAATYKFRIELNGIIYISTDWMSEVATNNVDLFFKLIGDEASSKVVLATSGWNITGASRSNGTWIPHGVEGEARENHLRERFCRLFKEKGSKVCKLDGGKEAAFHILDILFPGGEREGQVLQIQRELVDDMTTLDETEAGHQLLKECQELSREPGPEDGRKQLRVGFERLVRQKWDVNASLFRRLEMDRKKKAVIIHEFESMLRARGVQMPPKEIHRTAERPHTGNARSQLGTHLLSIQRLEDDIEKAQKYVAKKEARMSEIRGLMLDVLSDTASNPPRAYTQSATSREPSGVASRRTHLRRNQSNTSGEANDIDKFKSNIARIETLRKSQQGREDAITGDVRRVRSRPPRVDRWAQEVERNKFRADLYRTSLLAFEKDPDSKMANNPILRRRSADMKDVDTLCERYQFPIGDRKELQVPLSHMGQNFATSSSWLFYQSYLLRNAILMVYHNCRKLQTAELAGAWFSILVQEPSSYSRTRVVNLIRVNIDDVREVVDRLSSFVNVLQDLVSERNVPITVSTLIRLTGEVNLLYRKIFERLGLEDLLPDHRHRYDLAPGIETRMGNRLLEGSIYFVEMLSQWWCATRALDVGVVVYERAHISDSTQTFSIDLTSKLPRIRAGKLQDTPQGPKHPKSLRYVSRRLNCLDGFFEGLPVWILAMGEVNNDLYLGADIETIADAWGPVWKVVEQSQPDLIVKYNVGGGSIVPWPCNPDIHPKLRPNERLCHWKSNDECIHPHVEGSTNVGSSASSSDSDETREDPVEAANFSGNEILIIGARQDHRLQFYPCHCSLREIQQDLKNAGRLDRIIASKSYRYIDSRQRSLVGGSHGIQIGTATTSKDESQKPYKVGLLDRWENEPCSRDPRDFEDMWGVAVSLCTMNARRVRLIELFAEESVVTLLRSFPWSERHQRDSFLDAIRSADPFALGDLWEDNPAWQTSLGNAILICLRILFKTGYNEGRDEFHMLWLPPGCRDPRRVTFEPSDQRWYNFLKDTTDSMTVAVIIEDSLGYGPCRGHEREWFKYPSVLDTAICVNRDIPPAERLTRFRDTDDGYYYIPRRYGGSWRIAWGVSGLEPGVKFWTGPQNRVSTIRRFNSRHLLLVMDTVKREKLQKLIGLKPTEHWKGHWEYTDVELDGDGDRPIPVHIKS